MYFDPWQLCSPALCTLSWKSWSMYILRFGSQEYKVCFHVSKSPVFISLYSRGLNLFTGLCIISFFRDEVSLLHVFFKNEFIVQYKRDQLYGIEDLVCKSGFVILCTKKNTCLSQLLHSALITFQTNFCISLLVIPYLNLKTVCSMINDHRCFTFFFKLIRLWIFDAIQSQKNKPRSSKEDH